MGNVAKPTPEQAFEEVLSVIETARTADDIRTAAEYLGAVTRVFGFERANASYGHDSLDIWLPDTPDQKGRRLFAHQTFDKAVQEDAEELLAAADVGFFPGLVRGEAYSVREVPRITINLLDHNMTKPTAERISEHFLAPMVKSLFTTHGVIPAERTMSNAVHAEDIRIEGGKSHFDVDLRLVPPYIFEPVSAEELVPRTVANAARYGNRVVDHLAKDLTS